MDHLQMQIPEFWHNVTVTFFVGNTRQLNTSEKFPSKILLLFVTVFPTIEWWWFKICRNVLVLVALKTLLVCQFFCVLFIFSCKVVIFSSFYRDGRDLANNICLSQYADAIDYDDQEFYQKKNLFHLVQLINLCSKGTF